ncbi:MAG TPA: GGDEF domain-containing protein [Sandaracinaceae bacterium LLY-WYZ-13_1]|nr:GGDEF domain-containing protein [Sandaracinaceae bacterium LLY-WYZ-13_1]
MKATGFANDPETLELTALRPRGAVDPRRDRGTLTFVDGPIAGTVLTLRPEDAVVLGRSSHVGARIPADDVSRRHARVAWIDDAYVLEDLDSLTGTFVEGRRVRRRERLAPGSRVHLGSHVSFRFDLHDAREQAIVGGLHEAAMRDALTGAHTRRYLHERLEAELSYAARHGLGVALVMLDLDHFKRVNDTYGHLAGDRVLRAVADELRRSLRPEDLLARYGGEELCLLLRGLSEAEACRIAERVRRDVASLRVPSNRTSIRVTLSAGVATTRERLVPSAAEDLLRRADAAMYRAKELGRDRTCVDREDGIEVVAQRF